jgi:hypothetical protein
MSCQTVPMTVKDGTQGMDIWTLKTAVSNLFWQTATTITVGWFAERRCKHNNEWYTQLPK